MNFAKKRNIIIEFVKNCKYEIYILLGILCLLLVPYLYAVALGYNTNVLPDFAAVWIRGFSLILFGAALPTAVLLMITELIIIKVKTSRITCKLPLTEKEMDELSKNKTCEEVLMEMKEFLSYTVLGQKYYLYEYFNRRYSRLLTPFFLYISKKYPDTEFEEGFAFMRDIENLIAKESKNKRVSYFG